MVKLLKIREGLWSWFQGASINCSKEVGKQSQSTGEIMKYNPGSLVGAED